MPEKTDRNLICRDYHDVHKDLATNFRGAYSPQSSALHAGAGQLP